MMNTGLLFLLIAILIICFYLLIIDITKIISKTNIRKKETEREKLQRKCHELQRYLFLYSYKQKTLVQLIEDLKKDRKEFSDLVKQGKLKKNENLSIEENPELWLEVTKKKYKLNNIDNLF